MARPPSLPSPVVPRLRAAGALLALGLSQTAQTAAAEPASHPSPPPSPATTASAAGALTAPQPRNGTFVVDVYDPSGAAVRYVISPQGRQLMLEAQRALRSIERASALVRAVERRARADDRDAQACALKARAEVDHLRAVSRHAFAALKRNVFGGRSDLARNHYAVIAVGQQRALERSARAPACLSHRYRARGDTRITVGELPGERAP